MPRTCINAAHERVDPRVEFRRSDPVPHDPLGLLDQHAHRKSHDEAGRPGSILMRYAVEEPWHDGAGCLAETCRDAEQPVAALGLHADDPLPRVGSVARDVTE